VKNVHIAEEKGGRGRRGRDDLDQWEVHGPRGSRVYTNTEKKTTNTYHLGAKSMPERRTQLTYGGGGGIQIKRVRGEKTKDKVSTYQDWVLLEGLQNESDVPTRGPIQQSF